MPPPAWLIRSTPNANDSVFAIAVQADGKILAGGAFNGANSIGGQTRNRIARLETDGRLDQTLNLSMPLAAMLIPSLFNRTARRSLAAVSRPFWA